MLWFIPSWHGDIRLEKLDDRRCLLITDKLTTAEKNALESLQKKNWTTESLLSARRVELQAPVDKVAKVIAKALKPGRKIVSAVKFTNGHMEEVAEADFDDAVPIESARKKEPEKPAEKKEPAAAASVAKPTQGCPAPDFPAEEIKAQEVLMHFLDEDQAADFRRYNRFVSVGVTTGHRYMVTSRYARDTLATYHRSLYDLDQGVPFCVHDWAVPPAEEMLALHLMLQLPGHENYLRHLEN